MGDPQLSICVCTYNASRRAGRFIPPLLATVRDLELTTEVVVVDDGSDDATADLVRRLAPTVVVLEHGDNRGAPAARNTAFRVAEAEWLLFLDDDVVVNPGAITSLWNARDPDECLVPAVRDTQGSLYNCYVVESRFLEPKFRQQSEIRRHVAYPDGSCFLIHRELFDRAGGFDERFAPQSYEDAEFGHRLWRIGASIRMLDGAEVVHHPHGDDPSLAALERIARQRYERRWLYCLVSLGGLRRVIVVTLGLPRTARESLRARSVDPLFGYLTALWRWRFLYKAPRRASVA